MYFFVRDYNSRGTDSLEVHRGHDHSHDHANGHIPRTLHKQNETVEKDCISKPCRYRKYKTHDHYMTTCFGREWPHLAHWQIELEMALNMELCTLSGGVVQEVRTMTGFSET